MILKNSFLFSLIIIFLIACNKNAVPNHSHIIVQEVREVQTVEDVLPPPMDIKSNFKTLQEWLITLTKEEAPKKSIDEYEFGFFTSSDNIHTMFVVGENTFDSGDSSSTTIDFKPKNMYYPLPVNQYKNLNWREVNDTLTLQLKAFINTEEFKNSFLAKANKITLNGYSIWSK